MPWAVCAVEELAVVLAGAVEEEGAATVAKIGVIRVTVAPMAVMAKVVTVAVMTVTEAVTIITAAAVMAAMEDTEATITRTMVNTPTGISLVRFSVGVQ